MKVKELIELLKTVQQDFDVVMGYDGNYGKADPSGKTKRICYGGNLTIQILCDDRY